ncbi:MAG TPA: hypothetical protein DGQ94_14925 [Pseudomonas sp.]|nr:hypothetical protein [Pseudomonas sp.]
MLHGKLLSVTTKAGIGQGYTVEAVAVTRDRCRSGLVSRKGCKAAPAFHAPLLKSRGRPAALSRHKAAPTRH